MLDPNNNEIQKQKKNYNKIIISNIEIFFPYSPHESQILFMKKIIYNLNQKFLAQGNYKSLCAIESPPGTKKTICTLSACFAWIFDMRKTNSYKGKIIYIVKNNQKMHKIMNLLNILYYKPKICLLYSPDENKYENCELKNKINNSDLIFIAYENFFDKNLKRIYGYEIFNNILIFDEAENLDKICENFQSIFISTLDLEEIKTTLFEFAENKDIENFLENNEEYDNININDIKSEILSMDRIISNINLNREKIIEGEVYPNKGLILKNKEFLSLFLTKNNNIDDMQYITLDNIKKHILLLINVEKLINIFFSKNTKIIILASVLEKIYNFYIKQGENLIDSYTFFLFLEKKEKNEQIIKLNMYCFDPSIAFKEFILDLKPYSVFLISNYFGPYDLLENEFKIRFDIKLQNNCIYQKDFFQFNIIESTLFKEEKIDFILDEINSNNIKMKLALGYTLLSLCYSNPKGNILVFFPSMTYLYQCNLIWKENNIIDDISKIKKVKFFQEEEEISNKEIKNKNYIYFTEFDTSNSYNKLKEAKNKKINMVIILGIPQEKQYNFNDKIQLKINYIDSKKNRILENKKNINYYDDYNIDDISGERWYEKNIMIQINIFLGKALKLINGLGTIICIDSRYINFINNSCFSWYLKNKAEIVNIINRNYFDELLDFYTKIENKEKNIFKEYNKEKINIKRNKDIINNNNDNDPAESENFFVYKINKNKLFLIQEEENNLNIIKEEEIIPEQEFKIINNNIDTKLLKKKQKRIQSEEKKNEKINYNKIKKEEVQNINNRYNENIFQNICDDYQNLENKKENDNNNKINIENDNDNDIEYEPNPEIFDILNKNNFTEESNEIFECPICFKSSKNYPDLIYSRSKCKHVLCNVCWSGWFTEKFECPICKAKARPKTLKRIIFVK